jgi:prepilin-type N-terminal cleavage/methylation domain-containing protein
MHHKPNRFRSVAGFTMVELLVVIVIIASLAAIAFTVSARMKTRGESMKSVANMRQVGSLLMGLAIDKSSRLPAPKGAVVDAGGNAVEGLYWHQAIVGQLYADLDPARLKDNKWWEQTNPILHHPKCTKLSKPYAVATIGP